MEHWDLRSLDVEPHHPKILHSRRGEARSIAIHLPAGEELQEHQVHERAYLVVVQGQVEFGKDDSNKVEAGVGHVALGDPKERHEVRATEDARLLLILSPWPGEGHPSQRG